MAKAGAVKGRSCRGVFQALGFSAVCPRQKQLWPRVETARDFLSPGIETPFGNRRRWKREWLGRPGTWQKQVWQRVEAAGGFFQALGFSAGCQATDRTV